MENGHSFGMRWENGNRFEILLSGLKKFDSTNTGHGRPSRIQTGLTHKITRLTIFMGCVYVCVFSILCLMAFYLTLLN